MAPDPDPALLGSGFEGANKISDFPKFFCLFLSVGTLTSVFKDKISLRSHKTLEFMVYFNWFAC
jgi:hypothetical protein